jgi:mRNA interferase MazF
VLVISHDVVNARSGTVIALAVTSRPPKVGYPLAVPVRGVRMPRPSWVKTNQVRTLSTERFGTRLGRMSEEELGGVIEALRELID